MGNSCDGHTSAPGCDRLGKAQDDVPDYGAGDVFGGVAAIEDILLQVEKTSEKGKNQDVKKNFATKLKTIRHDLEFIKSLSSQHEKPSTEQSGGAALKKSARSHRRERWSFEGSLWSSNGKRSGKD